MTRAKDISKIVTDADLSGTLDVTGTVTAEDVAISSSVPILRFTDTDTNETATVQTSNAGHILLDASQGNASGSGGLYVRTQAQTLRALFGSNGDISFYEDTGTTPKLFWDASAESLGIGTSSPSNDLHIAPASGNAIIRIEGANAEYWNLIGATNDKFIIQNETEGNVLTIEDGKVGIGTSSPDKPLHVVGPEGVTTFSSYGARDVLVLENNDNANVQLITGNTSSATILFSDPDASGSGRIGYSHSSNDMFFYTNGSQAMSIDSSGNLLVGKSSSSINSNGFELRGSNGASTFTRDDATVSFFVRSTGNGDILEFRKDSTKIGSIGSNGGLYMYIGTEGATDCHLKFISLSTPSVRPSTASGNNNDNSIDLGAGSARFDDIYATNGTIQTSDRNEKQDIEEISDAEQRVAVVAKGLIRKFRWKDKVAEKGENARTHFGIIAQDLQDAFTAEGLDAGDYAMFISNTCWELDGETYDTEEEAPEGATQKTRLGVRYNQLLAFIISAI